MTYALIDTHGATSRAATITMVLMTGCGGGAAVAAEAGASAAPAVTALQCGHVIDTANGKTLGATTILTEGGHIKEVLSVH